MSVNTVFKEWNCKEMEEMASENRRMKSRTNGEASETLVVGWSRKGTASFNALERVCGAGWRYKNKLPQFANFGREGAAVVPEKNSKTAQWLVYAFPK